MAAEVGAIIEGKVTGIMEYGAFVEFGEGQKGMVHISEVAQSYVTSIRDHLELGQEVRALVLSVSPEGKISLSIKKTLPAGAAPVAEGAPRPPRRPRATPPVWQGQRHGVDPQSFEDMMSQFKQTSEDKISTLRRGGDTRFSNGARRGRK